MMVTLWIGIGLGDEGGDQGVAGLVEGRALLLLVADDHALALDAHQDLVLGVLEVLHGHRRLAVAGPDEGGLVDHVGQVGPAEAGGGAGQDFEVDVRVQGDLADVDLEDLLAALDVGHVDDDPAVEAAGPQQGAVQDVGPVGGGDQDDAFVGVEAVHLDQELVQGLLALVVAAAQAGPALAADGVDLVDEDQAGGVLLAVLEQVADARGADADEHLDEVRAADGEEGHVGLAGHGPGQQGLARARGADEQDALGNAAAELLELLRLLEEVDDLVQLLLGLLDAGHVLEGDFLLLVGEELGPALAEGHGLVAARLHLAHEEDPEQDQQDEGEPAEEVGVPGALAGVLDDDVDAARRAGS